MHVCSIGAMLEAEDGIMGGGQVLVSYRIVICALNPEPLLQKEFGSL